MDRTTHVCCDVAALVDWLANNVHDTAESSRTNWNRDRCTCVRDWLTANETLCGVHSDCTNCALTEVLSNFENQTVAVILSFESVQNIRQFAFEFHVDNSADNLADATGCGGAHG